MPIEAWEDIAKAICSDKFDAVSGEVSASLFKGVGSSVTARETTCTVALIRDAFLVAKHRIRDRFKFYNQDLINNLFTHPYTKIAFLQKDLGVTRVTATRYLEELADAGFLEKRRIGRTNYYLNRPLIQILTSEKEMTNGE